MTAIVEVRTYLAALGTLGTLVLGFMPASPDEIGVIYEYPGFAPERRFGVVGVGYEYPALQIVFRGAPHDYATPRATAELAYRALAQVEVMSLSGTPYLQINPRQSPYPHQANG